MSGVWRCAPGLALLLSGCLASILPDVPAPGRPAPPITGQDAKGQPLRLEDYRGQVVVLHFWHTLCPPCRILLGHERTLLRRFQGQPVAVLGVSVDESRERLQEFADRETLPGPCWFDGPDGPIAMIWDVDRFPTTFVIDRKGMVRHKHIGLPSAVELEANVAQLLKEDSTRK
jgi:peroxiredoxin